MGALDGPEDRRSERHGSRTERTTRTGTVLPNNISFPVITFQSPTRRTGGKSSETTPKKKIPLVVESDTSQKDYIISVFSFLFEVIDLDESLV